jgi:predicted dehydrogenase
MYSAVVIGLGRIGALYSSNVIPRSHIAAYNLNSSVNIVAGIDPSLDSRLKFKKMWGKDIQLFKSVKEMLDADIYPDIVSICLEPNKLINVVKDLLMVLVFCILTIVLFVMNIH